MSNRSIITDTAAWPTARDVKPCRDFGTHRPSRRHTRTECPVERLDLAEIAPHEYEAERGSVDDRGPCAECGTRRNSPAHV
jgi:hypothetical protein